MSWHIKIAQLPLVQLTVCTLGLPVSQFKLPASVTHLPLFQALAAACHHLQLQTLCQLVYSASVVGLGQDRTKYASPTWVCWCSLEPSICPQHLSLTPWSSLKGELLVLEHINTLGWVEHAQSHLFPRGLLLMQHWPLCVPSLRCFPDFPFCTCSLTLSFFSLGSPFSCILSCIPLVPFPALFYVIPAPCPPFLLSFMFPSCQGQCVPIAHLFPSSPSMPTLVSPLRSGSVFVCVRLLQWDDE